MIDRNIVVIGTAPRISPATFEAVLKEAGSPASDEAQAMFDAIAAEGVDPSFGLACFHHESGYGLLGICHDYQTKSMGNTRSSRIGVETFVTVPGKGQYVKYPTWALGAHDFAHRLVDPAFDYVKAGATTIAQIMPIFAPVGDNNNPDIYIEKVISLMNSWIGNSEVTPMAIQIDDRSGQLAPDKSANRGTYPIDELILHETSGPHDVRNASPDLARTLDDATISWFLTPRSDVSIHYLIGGENLGAPIYRLCPESQAAYHIIGTKGSVDGFSIDNHEAIGIERMGQPNDNPGPNQTRALCELALDICRRNPHITPDRIFSHAQLQPDRRDGNTLLAVVRQFVRDNLGVNHVSNNNQGQSTQTDQSTIQLNNFTLGHGFLDFFNKNGGIKFFGLPLSNEQTNPRTGLVEQCFERYVLEFNPTEPNPDWQVRGKDIGRFYLSQRGF